MQFALVYFSKKLQNTEYEQPNKLLVLLVFNRFRASELCREDTCSSRRGIIIWFSFIFLTIHTHGWLAQLVRALLWHGRGHWFEPSITHHSTRPQFSQFFYTSVSLMVFDQPAYESNVLSLSKGYKNLCPHLYTFLSVGIRAIMLVRQIILRKEFNIIILETVQFGQLKDYQSNWSTVKFMMITLRPREEKNN